MGTKASLDINEDLKLSLGLMQQVSNETLKQILDAALKDLGCQQGKTNFNSISSSKPHIVKELHASLTNLILQIIKCDLSKEGIEEWLDILKINSVNSKIITEFCLKNRKHIQDNLSNIQTMTQPMLCDVNWKLDYIVKTSELLSVDASPIYRIRLATIKYNPKTNSNEPHFITFNCDVLELTDLVAKLKDATRHIERLTNN